MRFLFEFDLSPFRSAFFAFGFRYMVLWQTSLVLGARLALGVRQREGVLRFYMYEDVSPPRHVAEPEASP